MAAGEQSRIWRNFLAQRRNRTWYKKRPRGRDGNVASQGLSYYWFATIACDATISMLCPARDRNRGEHLCSRLRCQSAFKADAWRRCRWATDRSTRLCI